MLPSNLKPLGVNFYEQKEPGSMKPMLGNKTLLMNYFRLVALDSLNMEEARMKSLRAAGDPARISELENTRKLLDY